MKPKQVFDIFNFLQKDNLAIVYQGEFTNYILSNITELVKEFLYDEKSLIKIRNKLSFLIIEAFQNTMRYGDHQYKDHADLAYEMFVIRNIEKVFYIATVNLIENSRIGYVYNKLNEVNNLDDKSLKELYVKILTNKQLTKRGGAGLGFIEMVRKTKEKLDFDFTSVSDIASFFYFQMKIKPKDYKITHYLTIDEAKFLHKFITENNIILIHKGDYDANSILPLLKLAEKNFQNDSLVYQKKTFLILVEVLQNICKHSAQIDGKKMGIITIAQKNNKYIIASGNYIQRNKVNNFKDNLNHLKEMSKEQLKQYYLTSLRNREIKTGGLGLIDIARITENFTFNFFDINENFSFFVITIEI